MATRTWRIVFAFCFFLLPFSLFSQDSRFEVFLRKSDNSPQTGATVYVQNLASSTQYTLSEVVGSPGLYRRDNVPLGVYAIYVNGALKTTNRFHGTNRIYLTFSQIDPDANYQIDTQGLEDQSISTAKLADSSVTTAKVSTALLNLIGSGGSITNNPDDVTLENKGGSTIGIKDLYNVAADTTALKSYNALAGAGTQVYLKQLSATNTYGGGWFIYESSGSGDGIISYTASDGGRFIRQEYLNEKRINVLWAGAKPTNSNADSASNNVALTKAVGIAIASGCRRLYFPDGEYNWTKSLRPHRTVNLGFGVEGDGVLTTRLNYLGDGAAFECENSTVYDQHFLMENLSIYGNTAGIVSGSKAINFGNMGLAQIRNVAIEYFDIGIDMTGQPNNWVLDRVGVARCSTGVEIAGNANGGMLTGIENTNNHSVGIYIHNGGSGWVIDGGESGSNDIALKVEDAGLGTVIGHNFESCDDSTDVELGANSTVNFIGTRFLKGSSSNWAVHATTATASFWGCSFSGYAKNRMIKAANNFCNFTGSAHKNSEIVVNDQGTNFWTITPFVHYNDGNFPPTPDSTRRGQLYNVKRRTGISVSDNMWYEQQTQNGKVWAMPITRGLIDVRFATSGSDSAGYVAIDGGRVIVIRKSITSAATYFTKDTVEVDIYNQYYLAHVQAQWNSDSLLSAHPRSWNNTDGQVISTINHPTVTSGGVTITLYYYFIYQARRHDY